MKTTSQLRLAILAIAFFCFAIPEAANAQISCPYTFTNNSFCPIKISYRFLRCGTTLGQCSATFVTIPAGAVVPLGTGACCSLSCDVQIRIDEVNGIVVTQSPVPVSSANPAATVSPTGSCTGALDTVTWTSSGASFQ